MEMLGISEMASLPFVMIGPPKDWIGKQDLSTQDTMASFNLTTEGRPRKRAGEMRPLVLLLGTLMVLLSVPGRAGDDPAATPLRLLSYNIKHGLGMDGSIDLARVARVIETNRADLVALQEVDLRCARSGVVDQTAELGRRLGMHHAFGDFMDFQGGEYGLAVLSRHPITSTNRHVLPAGAEPRCALEVVVQPPGLSTPLSFVSIHLDWTSPERRVPQMRTLLAALADRGHPVVLAGDFNAARDDASMRLLAAPWTIQPKRGGAFTFPADAPRVELDYFVMRGWPGGTATTQVIDERVASDHRPILTELPLRP